MGTIRVVQLGEWGGWWLLVTIPVLLLLLVGRLEGWLRPDPEAAPVVGQEPPPATGPAYLLDVLRFLTLLMAMVAAWRLPPMRGVSPLRALEAGLVCAMLIPILAIAPLLHRSVAALRWRARAHTLAEVLAVASILVFILMLPAPWLLQRSLILTSLVFCGGLTLYREVRRRWRSGDRSRASQAGGVLVVAQFLSLIGVVAALPPIMSLMMQRAGLLRQADPWTAAIWQFALVLALIAIGYLGFYLIRRIMRARGFSWFDPPNWRTFWPDLKYKIALNRSSRLPFFRITLAGDLANSVRKAYIQAIVGSAATLDAAALIAPPVRNLFAFTFTIIGDPGEGDDSQLYPLRPERWEKKELIRQAILGGAQSDIAPDFLDALLNLPDFAIISSDVVYPAGELMDYERAVYRPYYGLNIPIYATPGNHDWYDDLHGFFLNFTYTAAHEPGAPLQRQLASIPWRAWFAPNFWWKQIGWLRQRFDLKTRGGLPGQPETQQRLSFFELAFDQAPLTVLGLDNGVIGSIDDLQYAWLERRLRQAQRSGHLIIVILGMPLYVDAHFAGVRQPPEQSPLRGRISYGTREIYELLRRYKVDVVIGGDTHAYQRYEVRYVAEDGEPCTMHHFVNGGGGAYLSPPVDFTWPIEWNSAHKLRREVVYQALGRDAHRRPSAIYDDVSIIDLFPSAEQLLAKFRDPNTYAVDPEHATWLAKLRSAFQRWYTGVALERGLTNALDHDQLPLLQSYVTLQMRRDPYDHAAWTLELVPWFSAKDDTQPEPQYQKKLLLRVVSSRQ
ncbi:MAG TPA: metallophosphoesterase [Roseiflexaceae bacterium]|nr:metallophosphoesterase [Roseiflexaceae bacterium]